MQAIQRRGFLFSRGAFTVALVADLRPRRGMSWLAPVAVSFALCGCLAARFPAHGERVHARVFEIVTLDSLQARGGLASALLDGVTVEDAWDRRVVLVGCLPPQEGRDALKWSQLRVAVAPQGMTDLMPGDYVAFTKGSRILESGPASWILGRFQNPPPEDVVRFSNPAREFVLCREGHNGQMQGKVSAIYTPLEVLKASLEIRDPLRGLDEDDVRGGRIAKLQCSPGEEVNPLFWYARLPDGMKPELNQHVEATTARFLPIWEGGFETKALGMDRHAFMARAEAQWRVELGNVVRLIDRLPPEKRNHYGIPFCHRTDD